MTDPKPSRLASMLTGSVMASGRTAAAGGSRSRLGRYEKVAYGLLTVVAALVILQIASLFFPPALFPRVPAIFEALGEIARENGGALLITVVRFGVALIAAIIIGWFVGAVMGAFEVVGRILSPAMEILLAVPALSWILVAVLWFKGIETRVLFVVFIVAMPMFTVNVYEGIRSIDKQLVEALEQFRPTKRQSIRMLLLPHSVPYIFMTTKSAAGLIMRILVFAELLGATTGVGKEMNLAQNFFRMDLLFAWTVILVLFSFVFLGVVDVIERYVLRWRPSSQLR